METEFPFHLAVLPRRSAHYRPRRPFNVSQKQNNEARNVPIVAYCCLPPMIWESIKEKHIVTRHDNDKSRYTGLRRNRFDKKTPVFHVDNQQDGKQTSGLPVPSPGKLWTQFVHTSVQLKVFRLPLIGGKFIFWSMLFSYRFVVIP